MFTVSQGCKVSGEKRITETNCCSLNRLMWILLWKRPFIAKKSHLEVWDLHTDMHINFRGHRISPTMLLEGSMKWIRFHQIQPKVPSKKKINIQKNCWWVGTIMLHLWISCWNYRIFIQHTVCFKHTRKGNSRNEIWKESGHIFEEVSRDYI